MWTIKCSLFFCIVFEEIQLNMYAWPDPTIHYNTDLVCNAIKIQTCIYFVPGILSLTAISIKALLLCMISRGAFCV